MSPVAGALEALILQHSDPRAFLEASRRYPGRLWWPAWRLRLGLAAGVLAVLGLVAAWSGQTWRVMAACALLLPAIFPMFVAIPIMVTQYFQFWLLYAYSPPVLAVGLLWGLMPLSPAWEVLGVMIGFPFLVGMLVSDVCTLWVHRGLEGAERERRRLRTRGPQADLPALSLWRRTRLARLLASAILGLAMGLVLDTMVAGLTCLAGCLHLEATAYAWLVGGLPVHYDPEQSCWRATCVGRLALFVPSRVIRAVFESSLPPQEQSAALLTLLQQGYLGPVARRAVQELSPEEGYRLSLHLSLHPGGAAAIDYIRPVLAVACRPAAETLASLAAEAAKPRDLQGWVGALTRQFPDEATGYPEVGRELFQTLEQVRDALLVLTPGSPVAHVAIDRMKDLIRSLDVASPVAERPEPFEACAFPWPEVLLGHLERHRERLLSF